MQVLTVQFVVDLIEAQRRDSQVNLGKPATGWPDLVFFGRPRPLLSQSRSTLGFRG